MKYAIGPHYERTLSPGEPLQDGELLLEIEDLDLAFIDYANGIAREKTADEIAAAGRAAIRPVSARQMLLALEESGLLTTIESYVSTQPKAVKISWSRTQGFERNDPMLNTGAKALGMTDEQIDNLFQLAASK